jgi:putative endonuclease
MSQRRPGREWEKVTESFLRRHGLRTLKRNFHCRMGEIDLIMQHGDCLVFVEVRYRRSDRHGSGAETVGFHKQSRIAKTAALFLSQNPVYAARASRFDVISVGEIDGRPELRWIRNAFQSPSG